MEENSIERKSIDDLLKNKMLENNNTNNLHQKIDEKPKTTHDIMTQENDPDLMTTYEIVKLPSKGLYYENGLSEVKIEYMTSRDEDILTTPTLIDSGEALNILLKRKIKTAGVDASKLLDGDRNAILLFLRTSSYGSKYTVNVLDPRTRIPFKTEVNLLNLKYKVVEEKPDDNGCFFVEIPMRNKTVKFKLLSSGEDVILYKKAQAYKEEFNLEYSDYNTMKLKAHIVSIDGNSDRSYISRFVDAMPALDSSTIRREIMKVSPDVDMSYKFTANDGFEFTSELSIGMDFFSLGT